MTKKKILILAYHYSPQNVIAAKRPEGWGKYLSDFGYHPVILTHRYERNEKGEWAFHSKSEGTIIEEGKELTIIRVPRWEHPLINFHKFLSNFKLTRKLMTFLYQLNGDLDPNLLSSEYAFKRYLEKNIEYFSDCSACIAIYSPSFMMKLGARSHKKTKVPFICDLRDHYKNKALESSYDPGFKERVQNAIIKSYWNEWMKKAHCFTTVSNEIKNRVSEEFDKRGELVYNGFDKELFQDQEAPPEDRFVISHVGAIHPEIPYELLFDGIFAFIRKNPDKPVHFQLIGPKRKEHWEALLSKELPEERFTVTERLSHEEAIKRMCRSTLLIKPSWRERKGILSGKLFEYLGSGRPILLAPDDRSEMSGLVRETKAGLVADSEEEVKKILEKMFDEWERTGQVTYEGKKELIEKYSKREQVRKLSAILDRTIQDNEAHKYP